jgi:kynurenine/2-aminoadipate aminotransferase
MKLVGVEDSSPVVRKAAENLCLFVPGTEFTPDQSIPSPFIRASFSTASAEDMDLALERLASTIRDFQGA